MKGKIDNFFSNLHQILHVRRAQNVGGYYYLEAYPWWLHDIYDEFDVYDENYDTLHIEVKERYQCKYIYKSPKYTSILSIPIIWKGALQIEEYFEKTLAMNEDKCFLISLGETATDFDDYNVISTDLYLFIANPAINNSVVQSNKGVDVVMSLIELFHIYNAKWRNILEMPLQRITQNVSGEYIVYKGTLEFKYFKI